MSYTDAERNEARAKLIRELMGAYVEGHDEQLYKEAVHQFTLMCDYVLFGKDISQELGFKPQPVTPSRVAYWQYIHALLDIAQH